MQSIKNYQIILILLMFASYEAQAQRLLGDLIENGKKNIQPQNQARATAAVTPAYKNETEPMIWAIKGINNQYTLEWLLDNRIHLVNAYPSQVLPGNWIVSSVTDEMVKVRKGNRVLELKPAQRGSTLAEYAKSATASPPAPSPGLTSIGAPKMSNAPVILGTSNDGMMPAPNAAIANQPAPITRAVNSRNGN